MASYNTEFLISYWDEKRREPRDMIISGLFDPERRVLHYTQYKWADTKEDVPRVTPNLIAVANLRAKELDEYNNYGKREDKIPG